MNSPEIFIHPRAIVETSDIGAATRIWAFTHVMPGTTIGRDCNIGEQCFIESGVRIGDSVVIKNGVALWDGVVIADQVFVGPNVVFTNDLLPRAKVFHSAVGTRVNQGASIGANATIRCGVEIGQWALIGAGSVVTRDVPAFSLVFGNPARVRANICRCGQKFRFNHGENLAECVCGTRFRKSGAAIAIIEAAAREGGEQ